MREELGDDRADETNIEMFSKSGKNSVAQFPKLSRSKYKVESRINTGYSSKLLGPIQTHKQQQLFVAFSIY